MVRPQVEALGSVRPISGENQSRFFGAGARNWLFLPEPVRALPVLLLAAAPCLLAQDLPLPPLKSTREWTARLPREVHRAVAAELRAQGRFEDMRAWFQAAYAGLDGRPLRDDRGSVIPWVQAARKAETEAIVLPLREALAVLRRDAEFLALEPRWAELSGSHLPARSQ